MAKQKFTDSQFVINLAAPLILSVVFAKFADSTYKADVREVVDLSTIFLPAVLMGHLLVDWISANLLNRQERGLPAFCLTGIVSLLLVEGYLSIWAFDANSNVSMIVFLMIISLATAYDFLRCLNGTRRFLYVLSTAGRVFIFLLAFVAFASWYPDKNTTPFAIILFCYLVIKLFRYRLFNTVG